MFTGIVAALGQIADKRMRNGDCHFLIAPAADFLAELNVGSSIAVNGVCLTASALTKEGFNVYVSAETLSCTALGQLNNGARVNLEQSVRVGDTLDGHLVTGHIDGVGTVIGREMINESVQFEIEIPATLTKFIAIKGSVCIDGVSLTVNAVEESRFIVNIIPYTLKHTGFLTLRSGDQVNIEIDLIARYIARVMQVEKM